MTRKQVITELEKTLEKLKELVRYEAQQEVFEYIDTNYTTKQISVAKLKRIFKPKN